MRCLLSMSAAIAILALAGCTGDPGPQGPTGPAGQAGGVRLGNPRLAQARAEVNAARQEAADSFAAGVLPIIKQIQKSGVSSLRGVAKALSARGVQTARGGEWTAVQVSDVLRRA